MPYEKRVPFINPFHSAYFNFLQTESIPGSGTTKSI